MEPKKVGRAQNTAESDSWLQQQRKMDSFI